MPFNKRNSEQRRLDSLEAFRAAVWGNPTIFTVRRQSPYRAGRMVEYLDLDEHLRPVQFFCTALMQKEVLVTQEYRNALDRFKSDASYKNGACIIGQPGIGMTCSILDARFLIMSHRKVDLYRVCCH